MLEQSYTPNDPNVVHEAIDGEVVIVNLADGIYYSTEGTGATVWQLLAEGCTVTSIIDELATHYATPRETVVRDVTYLAKMLLSENLLRPNGAEVRPAQGRLAEVGAPATYAMPEISKYVDMQNLLVLDPIHEVEDESGWPHAAS